MPLHSPLTVWFVVKNKREGVAEEVYNVFDASRTELIFWRPTLRKIMIFVKFIQIQIVTHTNTKTQHAASIINVFGTEDII